MSDPAAGEAALAIATGKLGPDAYRQARREGAMMSIEDLMRESLATEGQVER